jgi:hypothetical protein
MQRYEELIEVLEQKFSTNTLRYKGHSIWPLFRMSLLYYGLQQTENPVVLPSRSYSSKNFKAKLGDVLSSLINLRNEYSLYVDFKRKTKQLNISEEIGYAKVDVLFFYYQSHRNQNIDGLFSNNFLDPLYQEIKMHYKCLILEEINNPDTIKLPPYFPSVNVSRRLKKAELKNAVAKVTDNLLLLFSLKKSETVECFGELQKLLPQELQNTVFASDEFLRNQMEKILTYKETLVAVFAKLQPKVLVQTSYYHTLGMAINLACVQLNIKTVEMQHGVLEPMAFWNFNKQQINKFTLLPKYFWLFDLDSCALVREWLTDGNKVILGGNVWMHKMLKNNNVNDELQSSFLQVTSSYKHCVLLSMQPHPFLELPSFIFDFMKERQDVLWLIRVHPRTMHADMPQITAWMKEKGLSNYELELSNKLPLPFLVQHIKINITKFSSVVFDSALANVPTVFIDQYAQDIFSRDYKILWESAMVKLAVDAKQFKDAFNYYESVNPPFDVNEYFGGDNYLEKFERVLND